MYIASSAIRNNSGTWVACSGYKATPILTPISKLRISVIAIARFGLFRSPDPAVFLSSYFYSK
ncbi:hypothetical protein VIF_002016 [Vibrio cholerae TM 11079-80]|nr:hypothetical protein VIF_002016 [Vibrio cholerae TM 11079-80]